MNRPSATQLAAARAVLNKFMKDHGTTATDNMTDIAIYSMFSALGGPGTPAAPYRDVIADATEAPTASPAPIEHNSDGGFTVTHENILDLPVGASYVPAEPKDVTDELPDEAALRSFKKDHLLMQINTECDDADVTADWGTKDELVDALLHFRKHGEWPVKTADKTGGGD